MFPGPLGWEMDPGMTLGFVESQGSGEESVEAHPSRQCEGPFPSPQLGSRGPLATHPVEQNHMWTRREAAGTKWLRDLVRPGLSIKSCVASGATGGRLSARVAYWCSAPPACFLNLGVSHLCLLPRFGVSHCRERNAFLLIAFLGTSAS